MEYGKKIHLHKSHPDSWLDDWAQYKGPIKGYIYSSSSLTSFHQSISLCQCNSNKALALDLRINKDVEEPYWAAHFKSTRWRETKPTVSDLFISDLNWSLPALLEYVVDYSDKFGIYRRLTNNCRYFASGSIDKIKKSTANDVNKINGDMSIDDEELQNYMRSHNVDVVIEQDEKE